MEGLVLGQPWEQALQREWLVTDGLGGYASGTVVGPHTRRYHGLLVAPLAPPLGRHVLLSKLEETFELGGTSYALSTNEFCDGTVHPLGHQWLAGFVLDEGVPVWRFAVGGATLEKRVWMERGHSTTYLSYTLHGPIQGHCSLLPLCAFRDFHRETIGSQDWQFLIQPVDGGLTVRAYAGATPYHVLVQPPHGRTWSLDEDRGWWWQFLHREERARGLDYAEDLYAAGTLTCALGPGETLLLAATIEAPSGVRERLAAAAHTFAGAHPPVAEAPGDVPRFQRLSPAAVDSPGDARDESFVTQLRRAAGQFLVARDVPGEPPSREPGHAPAAGSAPEERTEPNQRGEAPGPGVVPEARTVLAGYHWFGDWGRDTMIALPGLALATGRFAEAAAILRAFSNYVDKGMLPNRFPDSGAPLNDGDYNTVDATLWYFWAVDLVARHAGPHLVDDLFPVLADIVDWHVRGTRFGIRVDPADGLVRVDNPQLTWMDAKVGDWVCTPRAGKPVEIAALWHHALALMEAWAARAPGAGAAKYAALRRQAAEGFRARFWCGAEGHLYDVVDGPEGDDSSLRPNQVIAAALADCPLEPAQRQAVVDTVVSRLWSPRGLRTLVSTDPRYRPVYQGDPWHRDGAYHQGTVWPWPLGVLVDAHLLVYGDRARARQLVSPLRDHLFAEACAGSISEIFDADPPHVPRGCIAQAWSVAEVYRAWLATEAA